MNVHLLIDSLVRQTTVLIAQLAVASGGRPSLASTANQMFLSLAKELKEQGVSNKVLADMFGLALSGYHAKLRRLEESATDRGRSVWEAVFEHVQRQGPVSQADVLLRFKEDDHLTVKSALKELVDAGLVSQTGRGYRSVYRPSSPSDVQLASDDGAEALANLVWVAVNRLGPARVDQLLELAPMNGTELGRALETLVADGRVTRDDTSGSPLYSCEGCFLSETDPRGWEAGVFDHYQAMVTAITKKLGLRAGSREAEWVGGNTFSMFVWNEHPMKDEVFGFLAEVRERGARLRERVAEHNQASGKSQAEMTKVIMYVGQTFLEPEVTEEMTNE